MRAMALVALLACVALAGCNDGGPTTSGIKTKCPSWVGTNDNFGLLNVVFDENESVQDWSYSDSFPADKFLTQENQPLDRVMVHFRPWNGQPGGINATDSRIEFTAHRKDDNTALRSYDQTQGEIGAGNTGQTTWQFSGKQPDMTLIIPLVTSGQPAKATPVVLEWHFYPALNNAVHSEAVIQGTMELYYRAC